MGTTIKNGSVVKAAAALFATVLLAVLGSWAPPVALDAWAEGPEAPHVDTASDSEGFDAQVVSAAWIEKHMLTITFDQPVFLAENAKENIRIEYFWETGLAEDDVIDVSGNVVTMSFASRSPENVYGILFNPGSLSEADGSQNSEAVRVSGFEQLIKVITKLVYSPSSLPSSGGSVTATLEGRNLHEGGWPRAFLYEGDTLVKEIDNRQYYDEGTRSFTFAVPGNAGATPRYYKLVFQYSNFQDDPVTIEEGADGVIAVAASTVAADPQVEEIFFSATELSSGGGSVIVTLKGKALTQLKPEDLSLKLNGADAGIPIEYRAIVDTEATASFELPASESDAEDTVYTFGIARAAEGVSGNPQNIIVKHVNTDALVESVDFLHKDQFPYHNSAGDYVLYYQGGSITAALVGQNLDKLTPSDFALQVQDAGAFVAIDCGIALSDVSAESATVTFDIPANNDFSNDKVYRFVMLKAAEGIANNPREFTVDHSNEPMEGKFRLDADQWEAALVADGVVRISVKKPRVKLNPIFEDDRLEQKPDIRDYVFFADHNTEPTTVRTLAEGDKVSMQDGDIYIELADKDAPIPSWVLIKGGLLVAAESIATGSSQINAGDVLAVRDESNHLHHSRYVIQVPHINSIEYNKVTFTSEGGDVVATIKGSRLHETDPALWAKVFVDSEKNYSSTIVPNVSVNEAGDEAVVRFSVPANTTNKTVSYRLIPVINGTNIVPLYVRGYDVVSVLPEGGSPTDVTLSCIEVEGAYDMNDKLDIFETSTSSEQFTAKIDAIIRGTNLSSKRTLVRAIDENGVVWPTIPVFECGATIRWQSSANFLPEHESKNEQHIELLLPRRLGVPRTFTLCFAPDGQNFLDAPTATVIIDNQGLFDESDMAMRGFTKEDLTLLRDIHVKYVDEEGEELTQTDVIKGYGITEMYHQAISPKEIEGYTLKRTIPNNLDNMLAQPVLRPDGDYDFTPNGGQFFFRDLKNTKSPNGADEPYTVFYIYSKVVDKSGLKQSVEAAKDACAGVLTSANGEDVDAGSSYVTPVEAEQLADALKLAQEVLDNPNASQAAVDGAKKRLDIALASYSAAKKPGKKAAAADRSRQMGEDGTALGRGASLEAAEAAILASSSEEGPAGTKFAPLKLRSVKQAKRTVTAKWDKVPGTASYTVYGAVCGKGKKMQKIAETAKTSLKVAKLAGRKLAKGVYCKLIVVAVDGLGNVVSASKVAHVCTKGGKAGNPAKVTIKARKGKVALKAGNSFRLKVRQISKKGKVAKHRRLSYEASDPAVATVSKKGVIKARAKGACVVYAYAQNGVFAKIKVTVK